MAKVHFSILMVINMKACIIKENKKEKVNYSKLMVNMKACFIKDKEKEKLHFYMIMVIDLYLIEILILSIHSIRL